MNPFVAPGLRIVLAAAAGAALAFLLAYLGLVIVLLATMGIPLGAPAYTPSGTEYAVYLGVAALAAWCGARTAARLAPASARAVVLLLAAILSLASLWMFTGEGVGWPRWWAPSLAAAMALGALLQRYRRQTHARPVDRTDLRR